MYSSRPTLIVKPFSIAFSAILFFSFISNGFAAVANSDFEVCKKNISNLAKNKGYSDFITTSVVNNITSIERVITLDKKQPEFSQTYEQYMKARVTNYHVSQGRKKLTQYKGLFDKLEQEYGVPRQYLVAFWGLETVYGKHKGKMNVLNTLSTLACDKRRSDFFTQELLNLFTLIDKEVVSLDQLQGSWAGAMGHMQFLPSALLKYAVDGDEDGKVDVWHSEIDALTTAANYLHNIGWQQKELWGREVTLPENFDFTSVQFDQYYPLNFFLQHGVTKTNQEELPQYAINAELYLPSGYQGPAYLLYPNFNVIMTWNLSKSYALSVGVLANKLIGLQGKELFYKKVSSVSSYSNAELKSLQNTLNLLGYDVGEPDGIWGPKTRKAIQLFQIKHQLIADGYPNPQVFLAIETLS